jgi:hypothetical protein
MKRIIAILILLALTVTDLAACAAKPATQQHFSSPPTEAEIAEFRRTHPVPGTVHASVAYTDVLSEEALRNTGVIIYIEIISEIEIREVTSDSGKIWFLPNYRARIGEVISLDPNSDNYVDYIVDDNVYIWYSPMYAFPMEIGEKYLIIGNNTPNSYEISSVWNGLPTIACSTFNTFFITDSAYIITADEPSAELSHTGESLAEFSDIIRGIAEELDWNVDVSSSKQTDDVKTEEE